MNEWARKLRYFELGLDSRINDVRRLRASQGDPDGPPALSLRLVAEKLYDALSEATDGTNGWRPLAREALADFAELFPSPG